MATNQISSVAATIKSTITKKTFMEGVALLKDNDLTESPENLLMQILDVFSGYKITNWNHDSFVKMIFEEDNDFVVREYDTDTQIYVHELIGAEHVIELAYKTKYMVNREYKNYIDEAPVIIQALGYILFNTELYPDDSPIKIY